MDKLLFLKLLKKYGLKGLVMYNQLTRKNYVDFPEFGRIYFRPNTQDVKIIKEILVHHTLNLYIGKSPKFIIDGGAFIGISSIFFAQKYPSAKIIAIEPDIENFKILQKNIAQFKNIIALNKALWNLSTTVNFEHLGDGLSSQIMESGKYQIQTITIDDIIKTFNIHQIDLLKLDVEGAEKQIFSNLPLTWLKQTKTLIIEPHDRKAPEASKAIFKALEHCKYELSCQWEYLVIRIIDCN